MRHPQEAAAQYAQTARREQARSALSTAITLYGAMEITFWRSTACQQMNRMPTALHACGGSFAPCGAGIIASISGAKVFR